MGSGGDNEEGGWLRGRALLWREGLLGNFPVGVFVGEGFHGPIVGEECGEPAVGIAGEGGAHGEGGAGFGGEGIALRRFEPAGDGPIGGFDACFGSVFAIEAMLEDLELKGADGAEKDAGGVGGCIQGDKFGGDAFFE